MNTELTFFLEWIEIVDGDSGGISFSKKILFGNWKEVNVSNLGTHTGSSFVKDMKHTWINIIKSQT